MANLLMELRVPPALRERVAAMLRITDGVASDQLDEEYRDLSWALLGKLARKRPLDLAFARREHLADPLTASFFRYSTIP